MPIRNWGGGTDPSDTFLALQDQFLREAQAARDRALAAAERAAASSGGSRRSGGRRRRGSTSSSSVREGVEDISVRMAKGQTNWRELLNFYREELKYAKKGSSIERALEANIENIEYLLEANGMPIPAAGPSSISSPEEAGPAWGVLTEDDVLSPEVEQILNDQILYITTTENGVYPAGQNPLESIVSRVLVDGTIEELRDGLIADARMHEQALEDIVTGRTGGVLIDPVSRTPIEITPENTMAIVFQALNNQYALLGLERGLGSEGDFSVRQGHLDNLLGKIDTIVSEHVFVAPDPTTGKIKNFKGVEAYMDMIFRNFNLVRATGLESLDPYEAQSLFSMGGRSLARETKMLEDYLDTLPAGIGPEPETREELSYARSLGNFMLSASTGTMTVDEINAEAAKLVDARPSGFYLTEEDIIATIGQPSESVGNRTVTGIDRDSPGWSGVVGSVAATQGLETANQIRRGEEGELIEGDRFVWVARYGESTPVAVRESDVSAWLNIEGHYHESSAPFIEQVVGADGKRQLQQVWRQAAPLSEIENTMWWAQVDNQGRPLQGAEGDYVWATAEDYNRFGEDLVRARQEGFAPVPMEALSGMLVVVGADGKRHYLNELRTGIHESMPLNTPIPGEFAPHHLVDDSGFMDISYIPRNGMPIGVGPGVSLREAQEFMEELVVSGELPEDLWATYGPDGVAREGGRSFANGDFEGLLWSTVREEGFQHELTRLNYQKEANKRMEINRRERRIQRAEEERMQEQMMMEQERTDSFGVQTLQDNAIEAATRQTGVKFGRANREVDPSHTREWQPPKLSTSVPPQFREAPKPIALEDMKEPETPQYRTLPNSGGARPI